MLLKNKFAIGCLVQFYEIDIIEDYIKSVKYSLEKTENEVFATCPSCSTLLAVIPSKLSEEDKCPNCNGNLVN